VTVLTPLGFAQQDAPAAVIGVDVTLTGASASAIGAAISVQTAGRPYLSPLGFTQQSRNFNAVGVGNINVTLVGAQAKAQAQSLLGASYFITPDGAAGVGDAGTPQVDEDKGVSITNTGADVPLSNSELDDITGFILYPKEGIRTWKGFKSRKRSADKKPLQEGATLRLLKSSTQGPQSAEGDDNFISTTVTPEDL